MKIPAMSMSSPLAGRVLRDGAQLFHDVPCEAIVHVDQAYLGHHGPNLNYRPYLRLSGEMRSLTPEEALPSGIRVLTARPTMGPLFDVFYEFNDEQLNHLVAKGYFTENFRTPEIMTGVEYELPVLASVLILQPKNEGDVPVVFVEVHNRRDLQLDFEYSGYDLAEYFENALVHSKDELEQDGLEDDRGVDDIFADERFQAMHEDEEKMLDGLDSDLPDSENNSEQSLVIEVPEFSEETGASPSTIEPLSLDRLYAEVIAPNVEELASSRASKTIVDEIDTPEVPSVNDDRVSDDDEDEIDFENIEVEPAFDEDPGADPISMGEAQPPSPQSSVTNRPTWRADDEVAPGASSDTELGG